MKLNALLILVLVLSLLSVLAENPPALTSFEQFYGQVTGLPAGSFTLKAKIGANVVGTTPIVDGRYGYTPTFKIVGNNGDTITFVVASSLGVETAVGTATYNNGDAVSLNFQFSSVVVPQNQSPSSSNQSSSSSADTSRPRSQRSSGNFPTTTPAGTCLYNWECGSYSNCQNNQQLRTCRRVDQCDLLKTQGKVKDILVLAKPVEVQSCSSSQVISAPVAKLCQPGFKRCEGQELQRCSLEGDQWVFQQLCSGRCDVLTFSCVDEASLPPTPTGGSTVAYFGAGIAVLVIIIGGLVVLFYRRQKFGPIKHYIAESRQRGFSDSEIRSRLMREGWEGEEINRFL